MKTLAAALTSKSHSLASLSELLKVPTPKEESDEHGGALTPEYVRYGLRDVQTTWECFDVLARRFASFGLNDTGLYELYSEASLGKAYLRTMGIKPWQEVQRGFPLHLVGAIMSAYFGGRAEVHIRRQITPVVHTDFLSMYPTVCTLMGLWSFVRANGVTHRDDTNAVTALLAQTARRVGGAASHEGRLERPDLVGAGPAEARPLPSPGTIPWRRHPQHRPQLSQRRRAAMVHACRRARVQNSHRARRRRSSGRYVSGRRVSKRASSPSRSQARQSIRRPTIFTSG